MDVKKVGVVGAGTMGSGIAQVMAASGIDVVLNDIDDGALERGMARMSDGLQREVSRGTVSAADHESTLGRIRPCPLWRDKVEARELGRKTGRGFFDYSAAR